MGSFTNATPTQICDYGTDTVLYIQFLTVCRYEMRMKTQLTTADVQLDIPNENLKRLPPRKYFLKKQFPLKTQSQLEHLPSAEITTLNCHTDSMTKQWRKQFSIIG